MELAEIEKEILLLKKRAEESAARISTEQARAKAVVAEEAVATSRETEVARRIAAIDRLIAEKDADAVRIAADSEKVRTAVLAEAARLQNEAENILSDDARAGRIREKLLDRLEGILRENVKPMEKIEGIKIVQMAGFAAGSGEAHRSPTDEVIDSALRFRAQTPLIDEMMKEIGVENAGVAKMGDIFRSARDAQGNPVVVDSRIEAARPPDQVGCVREIRTRTGGRIRERLLDLSDFDYFCTYSILESPMGVENYVATVELTPVTDSDANFAEWSAEFDCAPERATALVAEIGGEVFQGGFDALKARFRPG